MHNLTKLFRFSAPPVSESVEVSERLHIGDEDAKMLASDRKQRVQSRRCKVQQRRYFRRVLRQRIFDDVSFFIVVFAEISYFICTLDTAVADSAEILVIKEFPMVLIEIFKRVFSIVDGDEFCARIRERIDALLVRVDASGSTTNIALFLKEPSDETLNSYKLIDHTKPHSETVDIFHVS